MKQQITQRPRRLRSSQALRSMLCQTALSPNDFVMPLFVKHGIDSPQAIPSMPGQFQWPLAQIADKAQAIADCGIPAVLLFGIPAHKDAIGSDALNGDGIIASAIRAIKSRVPNLLVIADTCFCEYTDNGHCGVVLQRQGRYDVDNDATLPLLGQQAIVQAQAGADIIAPSGMMDGKVGAIRQALDSEQFSHIPIMSYSVKYASSLYGPFREAAEGSPQFGNRKTYQMDPGNATEALREAKADIDQGADFLMVKPAGFYLDILSKLKASFPDYPLAAYQVSGEYAMLKAAFEQGWLDSKTTMLESLTAIKRTGTDIIITYFAEEAAKILNNNN